MRPAQKTLGVGGEHLRPLPAVPGIGRLEVGVDDEHVERHVVGAKRGDQALIVEGAVERVLREPDPERLARQQRRRAGQGPEVAQGVDVVGPVREQVAVLVGARPLRARLVPAPALGQQGAGRVVEQEPAIAREQPVVELHRAGLVVEAAVPAAEVATRLTAEAGVKDGLCVPQAQGQVGGVERAPVQPVGDGHLGRTDHPNAVHHTGLEACLRCGAIRDGERRPILELPVRRVLEPDQPRRQHLEAGGPILDHRRRAGGRGGGRGKRDQRRDQQPNSPHDGEPYPSRWREPRRWRARPLRRG